MDTTTTTSPSVWVGCLGCYNSGSLRGGWVDALEATDISKVLPVTLGNPAIYGENCQVCQLCGSDEFWVFDHENFGGHLKGECSPYEAQAIAQALNGIEAEYGASSDAFMAFVSVAGFPITEWEDHGEDFNAAYAGEFANDQEIGEYFANECGLLSGVNESIARYFDFEAYGSDISHDLLSEDNFYFWSNW